MKVEKQEKQQKQQKSVKPTTRALPKIRRRRPLSKRMVTVTT